MLIGIFNPLGAQTDRLRCEVCQNLILRPMNTGLLRYAVATAPTVYGIETGRNLDNWLAVNSTLQQHLPFTVLKPISGFICTGSEFFKLQQHLPFTVLKHELQHCKTRRHVESCNSTYRLRY